MCVLSNGHKPIVAVRQAEKARHCFEFFRKNDQDQMPVAGLIKHKHHEINRSLFAANH